MAQIRIGPVPPKSPNEKKDYSLDWSPELDKTGDTITGTPTWTITGAGLTQSGGAQAPTNDSKSTTVWYEAGTAGVDYVITNKITTTQGRTHEASFVLPCRNAGA